MTKSRPVYILTKKVQSGTTNLTICKKHEYFYNKNKAFREYEKYFNELQKELVEERKKERDKYNYECPWDLKKLKNGTSEFTFWNANQKTYYAKLEVVYPEE